MSPLERHRDVGAYALGVLDTADAFRFENHLMECPDCGLMLDEFRSAVRLLMVHQDVGLPLAVPDTGLGERLMGAVARVRAVRRRWWVGGALLAVVLAMAGPVVAGAGAAGQPSVRISARDGRSGVEGALTRWDRAWGTEVALRVRDVVRSRECELVAVGRGGSRWAVTSWRAPGRATSTRAAVALPMERIDHFEVRATVGGERLLTLREG